MGSFKNLQKREYWSKGVSQEAILGRPKLPPCYFEGENGNWIHHGTNENAQQGGIHFCDTCALHRYYQIVMRLSKTKEEEKEAKKKYTETYNNFITGEQAPRVELWNLYKKHKRDLSESDADHKYSHAVKLGQVTLLMTHPFLGHTGIPLNDETFVTKGGTVNVGTLIGGDDGSSVNHGKVRHGYIWNAEHVAIKIQD